MTYIYFLRQTTHGRSRTRARCFACRWCWPHRRACSPAARPSTWRRKRLRRDARRAFLGWWGLTIVLGVVFLVGTMFEWSDLIGKWGLTISRNLFGTTYFTLVGFHALHVTIGVIAMCIVFGLAWRGQFTGAGRDRRGSRLLVLALRGWGLGGGFHPGVFRGTVGPSSSGK